MIARPNSTRGLNLPLALQTRHHRLSKGQPKNLFAKISLHKHVGRMSKEIAADLQEAHVGS